MERFVITHQGHPGNTTKVQLAVDTVQTITPISGCTGASISCEDNAIRYAFGTTPTNDAGTKVGHVLAAGDVLHLHTGNAVKKFKYLNKVAGSDALLQITQYANKAVDAP
jgi:hypothetical protein